MNCKALSSLKKYSSFFIFKLVPEIFVEEGGKALLFYAEASSLELLIELLSLSDGWNVTTDRDEISIRLPV